MQVGWRRGTPLLGFAVLAAAYILPLTAYAQSPFCPAPAASWTQTEAWVWSRLCTGQPADLTTLDNAPVSMGSSAPWPPDRTISAGFLQDILTDPRYQLTNTSKAMIITGMRVTDPVLIANANLKNALFVNDSRFDGGLDIEDSTSSKGLYLTDDIIFGPLSILRSSFELFWMRESAARSINISSGSFDASVLFESDDVPGSLAITASKIGAAGIFMDAADGLDNQFGQVEILDSTIDGSTSISSSHFAGEFEGGLTSFGAGLTIANSTFADTAFFRDADFVKSVSVTDTSFDHDLRFETSKFESEFTLQNLRLCLRTKRCELFLAGTNFGGEVKIDDSVFNGDINADGATAAGSIALTNDSDASHPLDVTMINATIGRNLMFSSTTLSYVQLANASIGGNLQFLNAPNGLWTQDGQLYMSGATVGVLSNILWKWPGRMNLDGMHFGLIGLLGVDLDEGCIDGGWSHWLRGIDYSPQPYAELAKVLTDSGRSRAATCVLETSQSRALGQMPPLRRAVYWAYGEVAGFGYAPEKAFPYVALFVIFGMIVLRVTGQGRKHGMPIGLVYSFSELIPLVSLDKRFDDVELTGVARYYFYIHKIVGYVIAGFVAAAISNLLIKG